MRPTALVAGIAGALAFVPAVLSAAPKTEKAPPAGATTKNFGPCGAKILPLVEGNEWTYAPIPAPQAATEQIARLSPARPESIVITVKSVETKGTDTVVTLEEKVSIDINKDPKKQPQLDTHTITSTITCTGKTIAISPNSFFFAGEPGGFYNLTLDKVEHPTATKATSILLTNGGIGDANWGEDLVAHWTRNATPNTDADLGSGKLELERRFTPTNPELIPTKLGDFKAEHLGLVTTGRITLDKPASEGLKPMELPEGWTSQLWMAAGVGVVQTLNSFAHEYQLTDAKLK